MALPRADSAISPPVMAAAVAPPAAPPTALARVFCRPAVDAAPPAPVVTVVPPPSSPILSNFNMNRIQTCPHGKLVNGACIVEYSKGIVDSGDALSNIFNVVYNNLNLYQFKTSNDAVDLLLADPNMNAFITEQINTIKANTQIANESGTKIWAYTTSQHINKPTLISLPIMGKPGQILEIVQMLFTRYGINT